jgi:Holliday junction resolvase-like predicted endonuclease
MISESKLQSKIINYAKKKGWLYIKTIKLSESGHADVILFKDGITLFIEVKKANGGVKSELQLYRQKQFRSAGFTWEFIDNFDNFKILLNENNPQ